ncbi:MAG: phosphoglycerate dehydrogenase [Acidobacteria bacterium]|nr:phosphoglycerate dehydrogenase [Acidobacteriota bacterium]MBA3887335.1 phosphoglycerate dehydrogenase [Acidobacteriota bacterium]
MHIVIADSLPASAIELLRSVPGWTIDARVGRSPADLARDLAMADALIVRSATKVDAAIMAAAPCLRVIARAGTGVDNVDVSAATERGIVVMNAPGANSISVAELTLALMLSLSRAIPAADAAMKRGTWEKKKLAGVELRGKALGLVGLGRIGQEVGVRARAFGMQLLAHDPFISEQIAESLGVELVTLDDLCARADYISLHVPATPETRHLFNAERLAMCRAGVRIVNTARGELIDEAALAAAIEAGDVAGAGLDVFETEPPRDWSLTSMPQVVATPHIAASTAEAQEQVGLETAMAVREFLLDGVIRSAVNFPALAHDDANVQPLVRLAERMGAFLAQVAAGRTHGISIRYYGERARAHANLLASAAIAGLLRPMLSANVSVVNARQVAAGRGIEIVESRSSRPRDFADMLSLKLHTTDGDRWIEGAVFEPGRPRLTLLDGVDVEAPLEGLQVVLQNEDRPGVIGDIGSILGRHGVNIASFALGRGEGGAVGVVNVDQAADNGKLEQAVDELRAVEAITAAYIVRL